LFRLLLTQAGERVLGYTREEILARPHLDLVHPDDRARTAAEAAALNQGQTTTSFENRYVRKDGSPRVLKWTSTPVVGERLMYAVARDVTERRQAEAELERLAGEQAALRRVATLVARGASPEEVFAAVTEEAGQLLPVDHASLVRYEPDHAITTVAGWSRTGNPFPPVGGRWTLDGKNISTLVSLTGRPARIDSHADASGALGAASRDAGIGSAVGTPILVEILRLAVRDDGIGGADPAQGSGLVGLSDRIEALGGTLTVASPADRGTTLLIEIPVESQVGPEP
jgi:PAS domain S-box-containing protein